MTFKEYLFNLPNEKLAEYLVTFRCGKNYEYDYDYESRILSFGIERWYITTDGQEFWYMDNAIEHQIELLESEYAENTKDENQ